MRKNVAALAVGLVALAIAGVGAAGPSAPPPAGAPPASGPNPNARPQTPTPPFPYASEAVSFDGTAGARLSGTLTLPPGPGPFPAVVLINGSGPNDRDETIRGHKPFLILADALTRRGVAVLRYDKRGVGASTGAARDLTTAVYAADARLALDWLRHHDRIDPARVGMLGHSEGGEIVTIVASQDPKVAFAVLLAAPAVPGDELLIAQNRALLEAQGGTPDKLGQAQAANRYIYDLAKSDAPIDQLRPKVEARLTQVGVPANLAPMMANQALLPWVRWFLRYDPRPALAEIRCPVLALYGSKDLQALPAQNLPQMKVALARNPRATVTELPGLNHIFQTADTGLPQEYGVIRESFAPSALSMIVDWVVQNDRPAPAA